MSKGIVYILTNPCLDGWVKIGMTERGDINARVNELNSPTNLPLSFRVYAMYHVENPAEIEKSIHSLFDIIDGTLHAREDINGRIREREFFKTSPETAYDVFIEIAKLRGDLDKLELAGTTEVEQEEEEIQRRAAPFRFDMVDIQPGDEIVYVNDEHIRCRVMDNRKIEFEGGAYSLSGLAQKLGGLSSAAGPWYFKYNGELLGNLRQRKVGDYK